MKRGRPARRADFEAAKAGRALAKASVASRMANMSPQERSEQARKASLARKDRRKPDTTWFKVVEFPVDLEWKGVRHALRLVNEMEHNIPPVLWTQSRDEARAKAREMAMQDRPCEIFEQNWSPYGKFQPVFKHEPQPDQKRIVEGLRSLLKLAEEGPQETTHE
jgi:hypothetical protein